MIIKYKEGRLKFAYARFGAMIAAFSVIYSVILSLKDGSVDIVDDIGSYIISAAIMLIIMSITFGVIFKREIKKHRKQSEELYEMAEKLSAEISAVRNIICQGPGAYIKTKKVGSTGWLVLSEDALEYYELKKYNKTGNVAVLLDDIVSTSAQEKKGLMYDILIVNTKDMTYHFNVADGAIWKEQIDTTVAQ